MLTNLNIDWYKPFSRVTIPKLTPITAVGGKNNTGKTSLLEAIFLLFDRNNPEVLLRSLLWRGFSQFKGTPERIFAHAFHDYDVDHDMRISATQDGRECSLAFKYVPEGKAPIISFPEPGSKDAALIHQRPTTGSIRVRFSWTDDPDSVEETELYLQGDRLGFTRPLLRTGFGDARYQGLRVRNSAAEDAEFLGLLDIEGGTGGLLDFIRRFFPDIRSLASLAASGEPMIYADVGLPKKIPLPALGDGIARIVSCYLAAYSVRKGGILLLDELGAGVHHTLLPLLWRGLSEIATRFSCQIVATSHSNECLSAALGLQEDLFADQFSYIRLDQERGSREIQVVTYKLDEFRAAIENDWEYR